MAVMTARLDALKRAAQARKQLEREPFRMVAGKLKSGGTRAVYRVGQGKFDSLSLHLDKLAVLAIVSGVRKWGALQKACGICMSSRSRQGVRS
jgi:hypothetical protein